MKVPVRESDIPWEVWYPGTEREIRGKALCDVGGSAGIGVGILELSPGCTTRPSHYHTREEEHLYVLSGSVTLHLGSAQYALEPGSYVHFPAGQAVFHHLENHTSEPVRYLMIGERIDDDEVIYPVDA
ncbi:MAG: cupin domain-containing protein [Pseudomonadota bacterium]